ncbi:MAG TPA: lipoate--protein ligase [Rubrivivax sp.]|nr:lipoate--protein ligase [Rubrivivax sp.]
MLPPFPFVTLHQQPLPDGPAAESEWLARSAASGRAVAHLWSAAEGLIVPRRYTALPGWAGAPRDGVQVRASGGGLVPQGPGVWNLTLVWPAPAEGAAASTEVYRAFAQSLCAAFARLGLALQAGEVAGAFCPGRFDLAAGGRKLVGTAQAWKRVGGASLALAHAVVVVDADPRSLVARANAFEATLGSGVRYLEERVTSVARELGAAGDARARTLAVLAEQFARVVLKQGLETPAAVSADLAGAPSR